MDLKTNQANFSSAFGNAVYVTDKPRSAAEGPTKNLLTFCNNKSINGENIIPKSGQDAKISSGLKFLRDTITFKQSSIRVHESCVK